MKSLRIGRKEFILGEEGCFSKGVCNIVWARAKSEVESEGIVILSTRIDRGYRLGMAVVGEWKENSSLILVKMHSH